MEPELLWCRVCWDPSNQVLLAIALFAAMPASYRRPASQADKGRAGRGRQAWPQIRHVLVERVKDARVVFVTRDPFRWPETQLR